jgi:hypothetical protein
VDLVRTYLPHSPQLGLYLAPDIPPEKLRGALGDYAKGVPADEVVALYDATLFGSAKDGAVFLPDRLVYQNNDLQRPHTIRYADVVGVSLKGGAVRGRRVEVQVGQGRTTVTERLDFANRGEAAAHVARFLEQAILHPAPGERAGAATERAAGAATDRAAVAAVLDRLVAEGRLAPDDRRRMLGALDA